jgi:hypothetical protein
VCVRQSQKLGGLEFNYTIRARSRALSPSFSLSLVPPRLSLARSLARSLSLCPRRTF